jgi:predicted phosphoribosyltransferase
MMWQSRNAAGAALAVELRRRGVHESPNPIALGLARGGVIVAAQVARDLHMPLDVMVVRKLGLPFQPEVAMGALAPGVQILDAAMIAEFNVSDADVQNVIVRESAELQRREALYQRGRSPLALRDRTVLLIDDGLATGMTTLAAVRAARRAQPRQIIVAAPVGSRDACRRLHHEEPDVRCICALETNLFGGIGAYYEEFTQVGDDQVLAALSPL